MADRHQMANTAFAKLHGVWEGTLTRLDAQGNVAEQAKSRIIQKLHGTNGWYQQNTFTYPDGRVIQFAFEATFDADNRLQFAAPNLFGVAIPVTDDIVMLDANTVQPPGRMWEMTNASLASQGRRVRTAQRIGPDGSVSIQIFDEVRVGDPD